VNEGNWTTREKKEVRKRAALLLDINESFHAREDLDRRTAFARENASLILMKYSKSAVTPNSLRPNPRPAEYQK
jgi:hypothetical protein